MKKISREEVFGLIAGLVILVLMFVNNTDPFLYLLAIVSVLFVLPSPLWVPIWYGIMLRDSLLEFKNDGTTFRWVHFVYSVIITSVFSWWLITIVSIIDSIILYIG
jgi:hypothetical protein